MKAIVLGLGLLLLTGCGASQETIEELHAEIVELEAELERADGRMDELEAENEKLVEENEALAQRLGLVRDDSDRPENESEE